MMTIEDLLQDLKSENATDRRYAVEDLVKCEDERVAPAIAACLPDRDPAVREAAITALIELDDRVASLATVRFLESDNVAARNAAIEILSDIGDHILDELLSLCMGDGDAAIFATSVLGKLGEFDERILPALLHGLDSKNENVAAAAAEALGILEDPDAVQQLAERLPEAPSWLQTHLLMAIASIGGEDAVDFLNRLNPDSLSDQAKNHLPVAQAMLRKSGGE